ncbi:MAG TPA: pyridoxamine 5'-phosphate oxidase family protein, partial [Actinomycetota bacterium]|nr:pyridoxamine 5'-phosphate oxidase family protein [Actinomycetota bacterium]
MSAVTPMPVRRALEGGDFCHVAAITPVGPHVTPMVFAVAGDRVWVTTSRGSVKARSWRADRRVAGLVRAGDRDVTFGGTVATYDLLDPGSWGRSVREGLLLAVASTRFTRKNARFFAGYAVDAHHVPFAWTPPGRVFAEIVIERSAILEPGGAASMWGDWGAEVAGASRFRAARAGEQPLERLPDDVVGELGDSGDAALGLPAA